MIEYGHRITLKWSIRILLRFAFTFPWIITFGGAFEIPTFQWVLNYPYIEFLVLINVSLSLVIALTQSMINNHYAFKTIDKERESLHTEMSKKETKITKLRNDHATEIETYNKKIQALTKTSKDITDLYNSVKTENKQYLKEQLDLNIQTNETFAFFISEALDRGISPTGLHSLLLSLKFYPRVNKEIISLGIKIIEEKEKIPKKIEGEQNDQKTISHN